MRSLLQKILFATILTGAVLSSNGVSACELCNAAFLTISEHIAQSDIVVLGNWKAADKGDETKLGNTRFEISRIVKGENSNLKAGVEVLLNRYYVGKPGEKFLLLGSKRVNVDWGSPMLVSERSFEYLTKAPGPKEPITKRLKYYLKHLESDDPQIANDAYAEFAHAPFKDIAKVTDVMPRKQIRGWIANPKTLPTRLGLYGLLLGLCGKQDDAKVMHDRIFQKAKGFRLGIDGVIAGYLRLAGEQGLKRVEDAKLRNKSVPFSETYAAMQALRFNYTYPNGKISRQRMRESMRILLDRPELADLVITDLARWKDWGVQDRLMKLYGTKDYDVASVKRAIVRYMLVSTQDVDKKAPPADLPAHVVKGKKYAAELEKRDPKTVRQVKRFLFIQ